MLTNNQKAKYIGGDDDLCPYCEAVICMGDVGPFRNYRRVIECPSCHKRFVEIFTLTDIEEVE